MTNQEALEFVQSVARLELYGDEMEADGDDAMLCMNDLIDRARALTGYGAKVGNTAVVVP